MTEQKILVPIDFSDQSQAALEVARAFAIVEGAKLLIVHVVDDEFSANLSLRGVTPEDTLTGLSDALHAVKPTTEDVGYEHRLLEGSPAEMILKTADEEEVVMIVMGTHGRTGLKRMVLGSVAETVVRRAKCPVLTMRKPVTAEEPESVVA